MRLAILSDVHGNHLALEAVLNDIAQFDVDETYDLGDRYWGGYDPNIVWHLLRNVPSVLGNTDQMILDTTRKDPVSQFARDHVSSDTLAHLSQTPIVRLAADGEVLMAHGTPLDPFASLMYEEKSFNLKSHPEILALLPTQPKVVLVGHTHLEAIVRMGDQMAVNVGAVSKQKDGCPHARWLLLEKRHGVWQAHFQQVPYHVTEAARLVQTYMPEGMRFANQLRMGMF